MKAQKRILIATLMILSLMFVLPFLSAEILIDSINIPLVLDSENIIVNKYYVSENFEVSSPNSIINTCACSTYKNEVTIYNSGNTANTYFIKANLDYVIVSQSVIKLEPQQSITIPIYLDVMCEEKQETLITTISSNTGKQKVLEQEIIVDYCSSFATNKVEGVVRTNPCELQVFNFTIYNAQSYKDKYFLSTNTFENSITYSENPVSIDGYKDKSIFVYFEPDCSVYGENEILLSVQSEKTPLNSEITLSSYINREYNYSLFVQPELYQCNKELTEHFFFIENQANIENVYKLKLKGPRWADLSEEKVVLGPGEKKAIKLVLAPILSREVKNFATLEVTSVLGDIQKSYNLTIYVNDCYSYDIKPQYEDKILLCSDDKQLFFEIENTAKLDNTYDLSIEDDKKGVLSLEQNNVSVNPGNKQKIFVNLDLPDENFDYEIKLNAQTFSKDFNKTAKQKVVVIPTQECYEIKTNLEKSYVSRVGERNNITFNVTNVGYKKGGYEITLSGVDWMKISDNYLSLGPDETAKLIIFLDPGQNVSLDKYVSNLSFNFEDKYNKEEEVNVKVITKTFFEKIKSFFEPTSTPKKLCDELYSEMICDYRYFEFLEAQSLTINLSEHFFDPDGDKLIFGVEPSKNLDVLINEDVAFITPKNKEWFGVQEVVFSASDSEAITYSDKFYVQVIDTPDRRGVITFFGILLKLFLFILLLALLTLLVLFLLRQDKQRKLDKEQEKKKALIVRKQKRKTRTKKK
ncbi:hypothetical protein GOV05_03575 [Candidatus Woesearchaeota archaeon]|nr:hypothetical protein [Candidatus Woesearchaeota archaeon]